LIIQLRLGPEFGPDDGMDDREALIEALRDCLGDETGTDSGSRSTNIKYWDLPPERWEEALRSAVEQVQALGLAERALIARVDYVDKGPDDSEWGPMRVVWPLNRVGPFNLWPEYPEF
jgi:hypothetical protein